MRCWMVAIFNCKVTSEVERALNRNCEQMAGKAQKGDWRLLVAEAFDGVELGGAGGGDGAENNSYH